MDSKYEKGRFGEEEAKKFLEKMGYIILDRNFRGKHGEIDIICTNKEKNIIVFVEVKTRSNFMFDIPSAAIDKRKATNIANTAKLYLHNVNYRNIDIRFDAIEVYLINNEVKINHIKNIF